MKIEDNIEKESSKRNILGSISRIKVSIYV